MPGLATVLDKQPPLDHDVFGDWKYALFEHRAHLIRKPIVQLGTSLQVLKLLDAEGISASVTMLI